MSKLKTEKKKKPSDYPLLSFRASEEDKAEIESLIEKIQKAFNKRLDKDDKPFKKNSVAIHALRIGLNELLKRLR